MAWKKELKCNCRETGAAQCGVCVGEMRKWLPEPNIPDPKTDYLKQTKESYRKKMIGRYTYLFNKPYQELQDFEKGLYWYLKIENYHHLTSSFNNEDVFCWEVVRRLENKADSILQSMKIPYTLIENYSLVEKSVDRTIKLSKSEGTIYD